MAFLSFYLPNYLYFTGQMKKLLFLSFIFCACSSDPKPKLSAADVDAQMKFLLQRRDSFARVYSLDAKKNDFDSILSIRKRFDSLALLRASFK
jgi:hypothetical protein